MRLLVCVLMLEVYVCVWSECNYRNFSKIIEKFSIGVWFYG